MDCYCGRKPIVGLCCVIILAILIIGWPIAGGIRYGISRANGEKNYIQTECLTTNYTISSQLYNPGTINTALGQTYTLYTVWWTVLYNTTDSTSIEAFISDDTTSDNYQKAMKKAEKHQV